MNFDTMTIAGLYETKSLSFYYQMLSLVRLNYALGVVPKKCWGV